MHNLGFAVGAAAQATGRGIGLGLRAQALIVPLRSGGGGFVSFGG